MKPVLAAALTAPLMILAAPAPAADFDLRLGYDGRFSIFGKLFDGQVELRARGSAVEGSARLHSAGLLNVFKQIEERAETHGVVVGGEARPGVFRYDNPGAKKYRKVEVDWNDREVTTHAAPPIGFWGNPPATPAQKLAAADPLTQILRFALAGPEGPACRGVARFFDGVQLYDLTFVDRTQAHRSDREKRLGLTEVVRCRVQYRQIAGFKKPPSENHTQGLTGPSTLVFARLGPAGPWLLSAVEADTKWGRATIELERLSRVAG